MKRPDLVCVLTTIQPPTPCVTRLAEVLAPLGAPLLVVGDRKGPRDFDLPAGEVAFYSLADQQRLPYRLAASLPAGHYARKGLGYLLAIQAGAACIYETDDDNRPNEYWQPRSLVCQASPVAPRRWLNVYRAFSDALIWPRGFPLSEVRNAQATPPEGAPPRAVAAPIQQGLADLAPDVDAIWRLLFDGDFTFRRGPSLWLPPGTWCPFNSQTTWWWPEAYPLLYLPSHCSFRLTDIWRSFVAQRCLWEIGRGVAFHAPEVRQERNPHDLMRDFADEARGHLESARLVACLEKATLRPGPGAVVDNLVRCYEGLVAAGLFPAEERALVADWADDFSGIAPTVRAA